MRGASHTERGDVNDVVLTTMARTTAMGRDEAVKGYLHDVSAAARRVDSRTVTGFVDLLRSAYAEERSVFVIGNGGSAANASHFAQDLSKGAIPSPESRRFRVLSLTDNVPFMTAISNDMGYDRVFDFQLRQFAEAGDVLVAISGSGNSPNVLNAARFAREVGMTVVSVTGFDGGQLRPLGHIELHVPCDNMCKTEAVHSILFHMIADLLKVQLSKGCTDHNP